MATTKATAKATVKDAAKAEPEKATPNVPEVRQCVNPESYMFGAVAVATDLPNIPWGIMTVSNGGHLCSNEDEVKDWAVLPAPAVATPSAPATPSEPPTPGG